MMCQGHDERARCSISVRRGLKTCTAQLAKALGSDLTGAYLYGSLARGCFNPKTSDVDVLVVTREPCSDQLVTAIRDLHSAAPFPLDLLSVTREQIALNVTPTPFDFAVMAAAPHRLVRGTEGKGDLLLIRQGVYDCDLTLAGEPTRNVIAPVPWPLLARSLEFLLPHILPRFKNPALMLCRVVYAFANRTLCSKQAAGEWALDALEPMWRPLIRASLDKYGAGVADDQGPNEELRAFEKYCAQHIARHEGYSQ